jgi:Gpi18-like mannosyltransferase
MVKTKQLSDKLIILIFFIWRSVLFIIEFFANRFLSFKGSFPYYIDILPKFSTQFIWEWADFDGVHYLMLAEHGYKSIFAGITQAFFPLFPLLIRYFNFILNNYLFTGLILANLFFLISLLLFKRFLIKINVKPFYPILFLLTFPTSYYFVSVYSESLFFLLCLSGLLFLKRKNWLLAAVFFGLSSAARIIGIFLVIPLVINFLNQYQKRNKRIWIKLITLCLISLSGFLIYSFYLWKEFGDPLYFATVQSRFGASRQTDKIILLHQVVWRYFKMALTVDPQSLLFYTVSQEFIISITALLTLLWGFFKSNLEKSYFYFSFFAYILPTLTGNFSSMPRYVLLLFPIYIILGKIKNQFIKKLILFIFSLLLIINTALFLRGYWVA